MQWFYELPLFPRFLKDYVRSDPSGRTLDDTLIIQVKQGYEPLNFTGHFQAWDRDKWSVSMLILLLFVVQLLHNAEKTTDLLLVQSRIQFTESV